MLKHGGGSVSTAPELVGLHESLNDQEGVLNGSKPFSSVAVDTNHAESCCEPLQAAKASAQKESDIYRTRFNDWQLALLM